MGRRCGLNEVPFVAVKVFKDGDCAVGFLARRFEETDATGSIRVIVAPEIVGVQKEKDAAAGLVADGEGLFRGTGFGKEERGSTGIGGSDQEPALVAGERGVLEAVEAEFLREEFEGFVVIADNEC